MTEVELAKKVIKWLKIQGWQVFQEVAVTGSTRRLDIAALKSEKLWAISCKLKDKRGAIDDANWWKKHSNLTSVAVAAPYSPNCHADCVLFSIGYLSVDLDISGSVAVLTVYEPIGRKQRTEDLFCNLNPKTASFAPAGMAAGKRATDFNVIMQGMADYLLLYPDSSLEDAHDHLRDQSYTNRRNIIETFTHKVKLREFPGLYFRKGKVLREMGIGK